LQDRGLEYVVSGVGVESSGDAFNSISLEPATGRPVNSMINAGAIATTGMVEGRPGNDPMTRILETFSQYTGHPIDVDDALKISEQTEGRVAAPANGCGENELS
jgi:glutaminase